MAKTMYQLTGAAAKRIAAALVTVHRETMSLNYRDVIRALQDENVYNPQGSVDDLMFELRESGNPSLVSMAHSIGDACAREADDARDTLRDLRRAFSRLGVAFEDDLNESAFKETR
jgi:hypothetical protein